VFDTTSFDTNAMYGPVNGAAPDFIVIDIDVDSLSLDSDDEMEVGPKNLSNADLEGIAELELLMDAFAGMSQAKRRRTMVFLASWMAELAETENREQAKEHHHSQADQNLKQFFAKLQAGGHLAA
jgi:hypothetical protein